MKTIIWSQALIATTFALAGCSTPSSRDERPKNALHHSTSTSDRFNNLDTRSNSTSSAAYMGAENSRLSPDISSREAIEQESAAMATRPVISTPNSMSGSTTSEIHQDHFSSQSSGPVITPRLSGSSAETAVNPGAPTGTAAGNPPMGGSMAESEQGQTTKIIKKTTKTEVRKSKAKTLAPAATTETATPSGSSTHLESATQTKKSGSSSAKKHSKGHGASMDRRSKPSSESQSQSKETTSSESKRSSGVSENRTDQDMTESANDSSLHRDARTGSSTDYSSPQVESRRTGGTATAENTVRAQKETELLQKIRREITSNNDLSVNAHNVKIISQNGQIYLRGPVADANEKVKVEEIAKRIAGPTTVVNQTTIAARSGTSTPTEQQKQQDQ